MPRSHELSVSGCDTRAPPTWQTVAIVASTSLGDGGRDDSESTLRSFYRREWRRFALSVGFHLLSW